MRWFRALSHGYVWEWEDAWEMDKKFAGADFLEKGG